MLALEKIIASIITFPGLFILISFILTAYLLQKDRSIYIKALSVLLLLTMIICFTGLGVRMLVLPLENFVDYSQLSYDDPYPVVVLGGGINYGTGTEGATLSAATLQRLIRGLQLYRKVKTSIIFTGGVGVGHSGVSEADTAARLLQSLGVKSENIYLEKNARTTYENGLYIKKWLQQYKKDKIYLVTSAVHMPRSLAVFEKQNIEVVPAAGGYLYSHNLGWLDYLPSRGALNANLSALHEIIGLVWYKLQDRI